MTHNPHELREKIRKFSENSKPRLAERQEALQESLDEEDQPCGCPLDYHMSDCGIRTASFDDGMGWGSEDDFYDWLVDD